jgi:cobalt-zinc-cadmium efflux system protein
MSHSHPDHTRHRHAPGHAHTHAPLDHAHPQSAHAHGPAERPAARFTAKEARQAKGLATVLSIVLVFFGFELVGALMAHSVVLEADALHLLMDVFALAISLVAMRVAVRHPTPRFTFGMRRAEPVAGIFNAMLVLTATVEIVREAVVELRGGGDPVAGIMLVVAVGALIVNGISAWLLHGVLHDHDGRGHAHGHDQAHGHGHVHAHAPPKAHGHSLNLRGVWLHLLGDALGSLAALAAAVVIKLGGPVSIDAIASFAVAAILLFSALRVIRDATLVLLEAAPVHLPVGAVREVILAFPEIVEVHDLHVWTLGAGHDAITAHVRAATPGPALAGRIASALRESFETEYVTVQVEAKEAPCDVVEDD